jgi:uncharacterized protein YndB with AHSA1/START domain
MTSTGMLKVTAVGDLDILLTRVFDAPRRLVFDALTKPELLKQWFGPHGWSLTDCVIDLRVGGAWKFVLTGPNGRSMTMSGSYREIAPPGRMVHTETINSFPESVVTTNLTEENGKTTLNATVSASCKESRDAVLQSGMERGAGETYDRLAELLPTLLPQRV